MIYIICKSKQRIKNLHEKEVVMSTSSKANAKETEVKTAPVAAAEKTVAAKGERAEKTTAEKTTTKAAKAVKAEQAKEEVKAEVKKEEKKAEPVKAAKEEKKAPAKKTTAKKTTTKKAPAKVVETVQEVYFEYAGGQILSNEIVDRIKEEYKAEGHRVSSIKELRVYIKPEERKAYYVINDKSEGKFIQF